ncbi:MAG: aspartate kinase [Bdellovibrionota bacterium]
MAIIVQKYGGTSVGSIERIENVARRVLATQKAGHGVAVVVSAMSGETNRLLGLAHQITEKPDPRELDVVAATGEQVTIGLLAIAIQKLGGKAQSFMGFQVPFDTDAAFMKARIRSVGGEKVQAAIQEGYIPVVAGFQGVTDEGHVTTLGRGGSDLSAVALAAAVKADVCEIYTDVDGVYTTDPNIEPKARRIPRISYEEMLEAASLGAKVMQTRSVEFGMRYGVKIHVRSSFEDGEGTFIVQEEPGMERLLVTAVAYDKNEAKVTLVRVPDKPGIAAKLFGTIGQANINVDMIIQNISSQGSTDLTFTVGRADLPRAKDIVEKIAKEVGAERVETDSNIVKVSAIGVGMKSHAGVAAKMFTTLAKEGINIQMISTSEIKVSCVIDQKYTELAVRALHDVFGLAEPGKNG